MSAKPEIDCYVSTIDGYPVVHIDTPDGWRENSEGPMFRVYINDDVEHPIWNNTPEKAHG